MPQSEVVFYKEGESVMIREWLRRLPAKAQRKCLTYIAQLEMQGHDLRRPIADLLRDGIYELRPSYQGVSRSELPHFVLFLGKGLGGALSRNHEGRSGPWSRDRAGNRAEAEI